MISKRHKSVIAIAEGSMSKLGVEDTLPKHRIIIPLSNLIVNIGNVPRPEDEDSMKSSVLVLLLQSARDMAFSYLLSGFGYTNASKELNPFNYFGF